MKTKLLYLMTLVSTCASGGIYAQMLEPACATSSSTLPVDVSSVQEAVVPVETFVRLEAKGFRCCGDPTPGRYAIGGERCRSYFTQTRGTVCVGQIPEYPQPIAVIIPPAFRSGDRTDVALYFHGNNYDREHVTTYLRNRPIATRFASSGRNGIMVLPMALPDSKSATGDYDNFLAQGDNFKNFMKGLGYLFRSSDLAKTSDIGNLALVAHSGGYRVTTSLISGSHAYRLNIREVYCMDCMYANQQAFADFAREPGTRLWTVVTDGGGTADDAPLTQKYLKANGVPFVFQRAWPSGATLERSRVGFVQTDISHVEAAHRHLDKLLRPVTP